MDVITTPIKDLLVLKPKVYEDERGYFFESWNKQSFIDLGISLDFVQDNQSFSKKGVLRGLHFQKPPYAQGKLVRVIKGSVLDVAVDIRKNSDTYGQHYSIELTGKNNIMFWIPTGFAHAFITLEDDTIFSYKCTGIYHKDSEGALIWNDKDLNIDWKITDPIVSENDQLAEKFHEFNTPFK